MDVEFFVMPGDKAKGRARLASVLADAAEVWFMMYGFTDKQFGALIEEQDKRGVKWHLLLDASQYVGHTEHPFVDDLLKRLQHADATISCAGPPSAKPHIIMHMKNIVVRHNDDSYSVWQGSVNFSGNGWDQANIGMLFQDNQYAEGVLIPWFEQNRAWAREHVPQFKAGVAEIKYALLRMSLGDSAASEDQWTQTMETPENTP
jgi:hypothetical protein